jgi:hypothetical protein
MATTNLCTLDDVLSQLGIKDDSLDKVNDLIERMIIAKTAAITNYIGYTQILADEYTEYYNGDGGNRIYTNNIHINSVTEINDDVEWDWDTDTEITSYKISTDKTYILLKDDVTQEGSQNVKVTYNAGFSTIPSDLKDVCIEEVTRAYNEKLNVGIATRTDSKGGITRVEKGWMKQSIEVMDRYRKWSII